MGAPLRFLPRTVPNTVLRTVTLCAAFVLTSCSLNYGSGTSAEVVIPEFTFDDVTFNRIEDNVHIIETKADRIEQYRDNTTTYIKNARFRTFSKTDRQVETEGSCGLLSADTENKRYMLFNNITLINHVRDLEIIGASLSWSGSTEQLTSGRNDRITIRRTLNNSQSVLTGTGFSASGISGSFSFAGGVSGQQDTAPAASAADTAAPNDAAPDAQSISSGGA